MEKEKAIDRIKKLLRMKRGGSAGEIENALSLAQKIAADHDIDINSVDPNDESKYEPIKEENIFYSNSLPLENKYAAMLCQEYFNVQVMLINNWPDFRTLTMKKVIRIIGTPSDIEIATYIYNFLYKHFRNEWKYKRGRLRNRGSFMYGIFLGIAAKLDGEFKKVINEPGLILRRTRVQNYMDQKYSKVKSKNFKPDSFANTALNKGFESGVNTVIRKAVKTSEKNKPLQLGN